MGSSRHTLNRRRRTEGPEPACLRTQSHFWCGTRRGGMANERPAVVPSSRLGSTSSESQRRENPAAARVSGRHMVRGTNRRHLSWKCAQVTGKARENGQRSGGKGGSSPWTKPSGFWVWRHTQGSSKRPALDRPRRRLQGRYRLGQLERSRP